MIRTRSVVLSAVVVAMMALMPAVAEARDHRGGYRDRGYDDRGYYGGRGYDRGHRRHDDDDDALAAGVVGLALGAVLGAAIANQPSPQRYYEPPPPRGYYAPPPAYYGGPAYRAGPPVCVVRERVWDPYAGQYVRVERRVPC